jgi:ethanolamine ammonia-lyase small subunit
MPAPVHTIDTPLTLKLTQRTRDSLEEKARQCGQDIAVVASDLLERVVSRPTIDEILAPILEEARKRGMNDGDIDVLLRAELEAHRRGQPSEPL